jgi:catalase
MTAKETEELWEKQKINVLDLTHVWPHKQFPLRKVGEFVLNGNAKNYFAKIEQVAFTLRIFRLASNLPPIPSYSYDFSLTQMLTVIALVLITSNYR